jgi:hypothetical protein
LGEYADNAWGFVAVNDSLVRFTGNVDFEGIKTQRRSSYLATRREWWKSGKWKESQDEQAPCMKG